MIKIKKIDKKIFNKNSFHPLQGWSWGEFKKDNGAKIERSLDPQLQVFFHPLPLLPFTIGYFPKGVSPDKVQIELVKKMAIENRAIFVKFEPEEAYKIWPNEKGKIDPQSFKENKNDYKKLGLIPSKKTLFDPFTLVLDISLSEEELLAKMHGKTRYNIRLAKKKGVVVEEKSTEEGLEEFIKLLFNDTVKRQGFYMHTPAYFRKMWKHMSKGNVARILLAKHGKDVLAAWVLFVWKDVLYYPYGASASIKRNLMTSNLICWEAIRLGKSLGCKKFDMWGGLSPEADQNHPWYGFFKFKLGYGGDVVQNVGSWDLVLNKGLYRFYNLAEKLRWTALRLKKKIF